MAERDVGSACEVGADDIMGTDNCQGDLVQSCSSWTTEEILTQKGSGGSSQVKVLRESVPLQILANASFQNDVS